MNDIILICICVATLAFCALIIYCILVLVQARAILKEIAEITHEVNIRVKKINTSIDLVSDFWNFLFLKLNSMFGEKKGFLGIISSFLEIINFFKKKGSKYDEQ